MNIGLYEASAALNADARWQDLIAQNLASSSVPGFKKQELSFSAIAAGLMPGNAVTGASNRFMLPNTQAATNFQQGLLKYTGAPTDVAIEGPGFLEVQLPNGDTAYTRDGEFQLNSQGQLVTKQGYPILSEGGTVQVDLNNPAPLSISSTGEVSQGADLKGRLKVTDFNTPRLLHPIGNGYFVALDPNLQPSDAAGATLRQGYLEAANTSPVTEMANLITAMRHYEANQRVIQMQNDRMGGLISTLGNPNSP